MDGESPLDAGEELVEPTTPHSRDETWCLWLDTIDGDITSMYANREAWMTVMKIVGEHPAMPPSHFFDLMAQNYATTQAVAVRRQADTSPTVISLGRLLSEIVEHPEILSRQRHVALYRADLQWVGHKEFNTFAGAEMDHVDAGAVQADIDLLRDSSEAIRKYVNKHIAHHEESPPLTFVTPTFSDLDQAIDTLGSLVSRYTLMLMAVGRTVMAPVPQYDWLAPFKIPWLPDEGDELGDHIAGPSVSGPPS